MKVLVVGSGGREHAITWKIAQSKRVSAVYCAPGNGGMAQQAECIDIKAEDIQNLLDFAKKEKIDLTVVGPEAPLALGIVDEFIKNKLKIFGPSKKAAQLESSKVFAKELMAKYKVPTADFKIFDNPKPAKEYIEKIGSPCVVKADGLAAGKGVIVAKSVDEAKQAVISIMEERIFGDSGNKLIVEDCLEGREASIVVVTDSKNMIPMASSQDHKRIFDGDKGPNTGGMGAYSPAPIVTTELFKEILEKIIYRTIDGLVKEGIVYRGALYAGIMITKEGPKVLEFNVRFGDPETQAVFPRLKDDLLEVIESCIDGTLEGKKLGWDPRPCVSVVVASGGYPGSYEKGKIISGLEEAEDIEDIFIFHAGTQRVEDKTAGKPRLITTGGRVLNVTALGNNIKDAIDKVYSTINKINFDKMYYRRDIGYKALSKAGYPVNRKFGTR